MNSQLATTIKQHLAVYDTRLPIEQRRRPGALLLCGSRRPPPAAILPLLVNRFRPVVVELELGGEKWRESDAMFCYQLACHLGARSGPWPEFEQPPFTALAAALDHVEQDAHQRGRHLFLMLNEYDRVDAALTAGTLTTKVLNELRHIIQHREYIARPAVRQPATVGAVRGSLDRLSD